MLKEKVEEFLNNYIKNNPEISITVAKTSTGVYKNGSFQMRIYYRSYAIRIEIKPNSTLYGAYNDLLSEGLVYQRASANPYSVKGVFSFFVEEENIAKVLTIMLTSDTLPTAEKVNEYEFAASQYTTVKKPSVHKEEKSTIVNIDNSRIEKKLDALIGALSTIHKEDRKPAKEEKIIPKCKRFNIESSDRKSLFVVPNSNEITSLIFHLKFKAIGERTEQETLRLFFADTEGERLSDIQELSVISGEEYGLRVELLSTASEKDLVYLMVQSTDASDNEARQMIAFKIKMAFVADFGL